MVLPWPKYFQQFLWAVESSSRNLRKLVLHAQLLHVPWQERLRTWFDKVCRNNLETEAAPFISQLVCSLRLLSITVPVDTIAWVCFSRITDILTMSLLSIRAQHVLRNNRFTCRSSQIPFRIFTSPYSPIDPPNRFGMLNTPFTG